MDRGSRRSRSLSRSPPRPLSPCLSPEELIERIKARFIQAEREERIQTALGKSLYQSRVTMKAVAPRGLQNNTVKLLMLAESFNFILLGSYAVKKSLDQLYGSCVTEEASSSLQAEIKAMRIAMEQARELSIQVGRISTDSIQVLEIINNEENQDQMEYQADIIQLKGLLNYNSGVELIYCPREINFIADALAAQARRNPGLSHFHQGMDRPRWLENLMATAGLCFG